MSSSTLNATAHPSESYSLSRRVLILVAVVLGSTLFREPDPGRRLAAALLACLGAACLLLAK